MDRKWIENGQKIDKKWMENGQKIDRKWIVNKQIETMWKNENGQK